MDFRSLAGNKELKATRTEKANGSIDAALARHYILRSYVYIDLLV